MAAVKQLGSPPNTLAGLSLHRKLFETVLRDLLLERGDHTVELYEGSGSNWRLTKTATPGKLGR
jgi:DNA mismatch repair protein MSH2